MSTSTSRLSPETEQNRITSEELLQESKSLDKQSNSETLENQDQSISNQEDEETEELEAHKDDEETECKFCLFMKGVDVKNHSLIGKNALRRQRKNKEDIVSKCFDVTTLLKKCMEAHADYYEPILQAEKTMEEEAVRELEREKIESSEKEEK